ncbi:MAG: hypothetical protein MAG451_01821 [Anaerolineales bacterium]|nr:hypothetical protein [Anaerolineales bacterium]
MACASHNPQTVSWSPWLLVGRQIRVVADESLEPSRVVAEGAVVWRRKPADESRKLGFQDVRGRPTGNFQDGRCFVAVFAGDRLLLAVVGFGQAVQRFVPLVEAFDDLTVARCSIEQIGIPRLDALGGPIEVRAPPGFHHAASRPVADREGQEIEQSGDGRVLIEPGALS